jgi:hypothetical protein
MSEQTTWIPLPKAKKKTAKIADAIDRVEPLAAWYRAHKPEVKRIVVSSADYRAFEAAVNTRGISINNAGICFRGFRIEPTS